MILLAGPTLNLAAVKLYKSIGADKIEKRGRGMATYLQNHLLEFGNKIDMVTSTEEISRGCQIGFRIKNGKTGANQDFLAQAAKKNIVLRYVGESGIDCIRVSTHYYNQYEEVDLLLGELKTYLG